MNRLSCFALTIAAAVLGGCTPTIDNKQVEESIREALKKEELPVKTVSCPIGAEAKKDKDFDCKVTFEDGSSFDVKVHQKDDKGGLEWRPPAITTSNRFRKKLEEQFSMTDVTCPEGLISAKKGAKVSCTGKVEDQAVDIEATFEDDEGRYAVRTTPKPAAPAN
jgi:hypothetical protein